MADLKGSTLGILLAIGTCSGFLLGICSGEANKKRTLDSIQIRADDANRDNLDDIMMEWKEGDSSGKKIFYKTDKGYETPEQIRERLRAEAGEEYDRKREEIDNLIQNRYPSEGR